MAGTRFVFESMGIGELLRRSRLIVPPNQRSYAWQEQHIRTLFEDLNAAILNDEDDYFLGTVVIVKEGDAIPSIADGQQRIATTSIFLARIRDYLYQQNRERSADSIDQDFLRNIDRNTEALVPRLKLNLDDNDFFVGRILPSKKNSAAEEAIQIEPERESTRRLLRASELSVEFVDGIVKNLPAEAKSVQLLKWIGFLQEKASVVVVTVPDEIGAYRIFETLNDRGLRASQADILKNYLFSRAGDRLDEAIARWSEISGAIESNSDEETSGLITYIRHLWVTTHGPTKERELAAAIKGEMTGETRALRFLTEARDAVQDYIALSSPGHAKWGDYPATTKQNVATLTDHLQVEQIKPLLFAVATHFSVEEADKAFKLFVSWSVRFLIFGGRGGMLDTQYSRRAHEVGTGAITMARDLRTAMENYVPSDAEFEEAFATARVSRGHLARYYLRAIEKCITDDPHPEFIANEDVRDVNLEHIMPTTLNDQWDVDFDIARVAQKSLGNMVLLRTPKNKDLGNKSFSEKKAVLAASGYFVTKQAAEYEAWGMEEIRDRQSKLAALALRTWPLTFGD